MFGRWQLTVRVDRAHAAPVVHRFWLRVQPIADDLAQRAHVPVGALAQGGPAFLVQLLCQGVQDRLPRPSRTSAATSRASSGSRKTPSCTTSPVTLIR